MRDSKIGDPTILFEHPHFLLVDKPAGLFSQAAIGIDNLEHSLIELLTKRDAHPGTPFVGLPHRLDRGTSGVMLIARNARALKRFGEQFQSRKISKYYMAVLEGQMSEPTSRWEDYVRKIPDRPIAEICASDVPDAKLATLDAHRIVTDGDRTLVLLQLYTGRMHQIRIQAAQRGLPVLGDWTYRGSGHFGPLDDQDQRQCMALHSLRIEFRHPQTGKLTTGTADIPPTWESLPAPIISAARAHIRQSQLQLDCEYKCPR